MTTVNTNGQGYARTYTHANGGSAAAPYSDLINRFVDDNSTTALSHLCDIAGAGAVAVGVVNDVGVGASTSLPASVIVSGHALLFVNAATYPLVPGDPIKCDASGLGVKAQIPGERYFARAVGYAAANAVLLEVIVENGTVPTGVGFQTLTAITGATGGAITAAQLAAAQHSSLEMSYAGAAALAIPGAAPSNKGKRIRIVKTGTAGAITITPASGTIAGGATHAAIDADNDFATFQSDGVSDWVLIADETTIA
jgi:hypothetical protein